MQIRRMINLLLVAIGLNGLYSCATIPGRAIAVKPFDKEKYLGKWYEIARLNFKYERDMDNTTATYSLNSDGTIKVDNQGYHTKEGVWKQAIGKARFVGKENIAMLKVSFFGPFYSGYNVIALDDEYRYALVAGRSLEYLWILSRETQIPPEIKDQYLKIAKNAGYKTSDLLWIKHDRQK